MNEASIRFLMLASLLFGAWRRRVTSGGKRA